MESEKKAALAVIQNLRDANCDDAFIQQYMKIDKESPCEQIRFLTRHRAALLETIHTHQKFLDRLDYLIYQIKSTT